MPIVETSVAVATPLTTAARITKGSAKAGSAATKLRQMTAEGARRSRAGTSFLHRRQTTNANTHASTTPGSMPPVKSADMETPVTEPMVISTIEGGIVSV